MRSPLSPDAPSSPVRGSVYVPGWAMRAPQRDSWAVSTRKLIIAALVCGVAILLAGAIQFVQIAHDQHRSTGGATPVVTPLMLR
jgi:hypothetical protein